MGLMRQFGDIRITEVVGQGGMGDVYAGYDEKLERKVAVKFFTADHRLDQDARARLLREARALSHLDHPNICRIHDYIESENVDLLVLEYIDGTTLDDVAPDNLSRTEKLRIASVIAGVLAAAHRAGIVHRDLKPENVMLTSTGEVKVLDFGLARWLHRVRPDERAPSDRHAAIASVVPITHGGGSSDSTLPLRREFDTTAPNDTAVGVTLGTPLYMSPEQARGETLTPASDMFSFGMLLQWLFTGVEPHPPELNAREIILRVSRGETNPATGVQHDIAHLIERLKQFAPSDRPTAVDTLEWLKFLSRKGLIARLIERLKQFAPSDRPTAVDTLERVKFPSEQPQQNGKSLITTPFPTSDEVAAALGVSPERHAEIKQMVDKIYTESTRRRDASRPRFWPDWLSRLVGAISAKRRAKSAKGK